MDTTPLIMRWISLLLVMGFVGIFASSAIAGDDSWAVYGGDAAGTRHSQADQITPENISQLQLAWTYHTGEVERRGMANILNSSTQNTPILVAGSLIICTPFNRVVALDPVSGQEKWVFDAEVELSLTMPFYHNCRGVVQWRDDQADQGAHCALRIILPTNDARLIAIDGLSGKLCDGFGDKGSVHIPQVVMPLWPGELKLSSAPVVLNGVIVTGSIIMDNFRADAPRGTVFAFDVRTGEPKWQFDPIPRDPSDPAAKTWLDGSVENTGAANVWSTMVVDEERDLVFLPTSSASPDFWGGERPGDNLYASSLVVLKGSTGEIVWHHQQVHHDIWDYDISSPPVLVDIERDGETIPAVVQNTKQGFVFVYHRETGEPLYPIEEKPVPQNGMPGEWLAKTQPFPIEGLQLLSTHLTPEDAWGFSFLDRAGCKDLIASLSNEGMFTPPTTGNGALFAQGNSGGANWGGPSYDPDRRLMLVNINNVPQVITLIPREDVGEIDGINMNEDGVVTEQRGTPYGASTQWLLSPFGAPCVEPPWGELVAVDLDAGKVRWRVPLGSLEHYLPVPFEWNLGTPNIGGPITTAGGVTFIGAAIDQYFRAYSTDTGEELWRFKMPAGQSTTPMTYQIDGRQYVVMVTGHHLYFGAEVGDSVVAFALPESR
ncbi:MAG: pyrroloquinoline quinone-dependent dehydrogenase [Alphaproteobacteria bacterium]|nr:MAG: pyrroloquinoline quinone-dependent dehydrogenase [Alphaproteobacteria bacterium]